MEIKKISMQMPYLIPNMSDSCVAYYLATGEQLRQVIYNICSDHRIYIGRWDPYYKSDRNDYDKFLHELRWHTDFMDGLSKDELFPENSDLPNGPDWYIFQHYKEKETYWSDNREQYEDSYKDCILVTKLSDVKARTDKFFKIFE